MNNKPPDYPLPKNLLAGKTALITAAAGTGIGFATAKRCAEEGARVFISDAHSKRLDEARQKLEADGGYEVLAQKCDVTNEMEVQALVEEAEKELGAIDILINNAGLGAMTNLVDMQDEEWHKVIDITLTGTMRCMRAALKKMIPAGGGIIVNNASVLGWRAQAGQSHYAAAKAGVMALTRCAALEAAPHGIRINCVSPSLAMHPHLEKTSSKELLEELIQKEAFKRPAEVWEVANVIVFLASDLSSYMTGEAVSVSSQHP